MIIDSHKESLLHNLASKQARSTTNRNWNLLKLEPHATSKAAFWRTNEMNNPSIRPRTQNNRFHQE